MADLPDTSFNSDVIAEFRGNGGKVGRPWQNSTLLLLHTTGAKSGAPRGYFDIDGKVIIVGSYAGADINPAWVHNLRAHPHTQIEIGAETVDVRGAADGRGGGRGDGIAPPFAKYQTKTTRTLPLFELKRT